MLDILAVEVGAGRRELAQFRDEMLGFRDGITGDFASFREQVSLVPNAEL